MTENDDDGIPTTTPELYSDFNTANGLAAVALFVVMAAIVGTARFGDPAGFPQDASITASIGYAMFDVSTSAIDAPLVESESFLVAFEIIDVVLVAALVGAVMLARRETDEGAGVLADGGRRLAATGRRLLGRDADDVDVADDVSVADSIGAGVGDDIGAGTGVDDDTGAGTEADDDSGAGTGVDDDTGAGPDADDATSGGER